MLINSFVYREKLLKFSIIVVLVDNNYFGYEIYLK